MTVSCWLLRQGQRLDADVAWARLVSIHIEAVGHSGVWGIMISTSTVIGRVVCFLETGLRDDFHLVLSLIDLGFDLGNVGYNRGG